jgi:hypothetical protein
LEDASTTLPDSYLTGAKKRWTRCNAVILGQNNYSSKASVMGALLTHNACVTF